MNPAPPTHTLPESEIPSLPPFSGHRRSCPSLFRAHYSTLLGPLFRCCSSSSCCVQSANTPSSLRNDSPPPPSPPNIISSVSSRLHCAGLLASGRILGAAIPIRCHGQRRRGRLPLPPRRHPPCSRHRRTAAATGLSRCHAAVPAGRLRLLLLRLGPPASCRLLVGAAGSILDLLFNQADQGVAPA